MSKQPPISVVNKPRKTTSRKSSSSPRKSRKKDASPHKKKVVKKWEIPTGLYYILMGAITVVFLSAFFYFFIRPYSYRWKPCYGLKAYGVCMPAGFHIHGIDVSHYQGNIDWQRLTQTRQSQFPIHFIFMKASEGGDYGDRVFQANFDSAKAYGFIRGAYHFYNPKTDPVRQADFFINSVKLDTGDLPPVLDIEKRGDDAQTLRRDLKIWLDKIERHYKVKPILILLISSRPAILMILYLILILIGLLIIMLIRWNIKATGNSGSTLMWVHFPALRKRWI